MIFKEWYEKAEPILSCEFGGTSDPWIRDIYVLPSGVRVYEETYLPRSIFKKQVINVLVDIIFNVSRIAQLEKCGISFFDDNRYTEDGEIIESISIDPETNKASNLLDILDENNLEKGEEE